jgi:uncharacterized membrane protein YdbT with pleckstrin-like domain
MNEISQILETKEKLIWEGKPQYAPYITSAIFISLIGGLFFGAGAGVYLKMPIFGISIGILIFLIAIVVGNLMYKFIHYGLTNKRVIYQSGIFGRSFKSINYDDIKNASVEKGLFNWLFNTGTIQVFTGEMESTGGKNSQIRPKYDNFLYISEAYNVLKKLQENLTEHEEGLYGGKNVVQRVKVIK